MTIDGTRSLPAMGMAILEAERTRRSIREVGSVNIRVSNTENTTRIVMSSVDARRIDAEFGGARPDIVVKDDTLFLVPGGACKWYKSHYDVVLRCAAQTIGRTMRDSGLPLFGLTTARLDPQSDGTYRVVLPTALNAVRPRGSTRRRSRVATAPVTPLRDLVRMVNEHVQSEEGLTLAIRDGRLVATVMIEYA